MSFLYPGKLTWVPSPKVLKHYHLKTIDGLIYTTDKENEKKKPTGSAEPSSNNKIWNALGTINAFVLLAMTHTMPVGLEPTTWRRTIKLTIE